MYQNGYTLHLVHPLVEIVNLQNNKPIFQRVFLKGITSVIIIRKNYDPVKLEKGLVNLSLFIMFDNLLVNPHIALFCY